MDRHRNADRNAELMGDDIVGIFLSEEPLRDPCKIARDGETKLRRFVHEQESICNPCLLGSGEHGVVVLADIKGVKYALKVVSATTINATFFS